MRDSYLQRQALPCRTKANSIIISKDEYETRSSNIWRADDLDVGYNRYGWPLNHEEADSSALDFFTVDASKSFSDKVSFPNRLFNTITNQKVNYLDQHTHSLYCPSASLIAPYKQPSASAEEPDVSLEMDSFGNQYLHLILPADRIKFLNSHSFLNDTFFSQDYAW